MIDLIKEYLSLSEIALHNANLVYSIPALSNILAGEAFKNFMLKEILTEEEARMHTEG
jgi:ribonucleoside-triphosphate reductase